MSHVAALGPQAQAEVLGDVRAVLESHPDTTGRDELRIRYGVDCDWLERA